MGAVTRMIAYRLLTLRKGDDVKRSALPRDYDVVVIGSGFGGSVPRCG